MSHLGSRDRHLWPDRHTLGETAEECEAEAVAYIAGLRLDAQVKMPPHLAGYVDPGSPVPPIDLDIVTKAAGLALDPHESPSRAWSRHAEREKKRRRAQTT